MDSFLIWACLFTLQGRCTLKIGDEFRSSSDCSFEKSDLGLHSLQRHLCQNIKGPTGMQSMTVKIQSNLEVTFQMERAMLS